MSYISWARIEGTVVSSLMKPTSGGKEKWYVGIQGTGDAILEVGFWSKTEMQTCEMLQAGDEVVIKATVRVWRNKDFNNISIEGEQIRLAADKGKATEPQAAAKQSAPLPSESDGDDSLPF